MAATRETLFDLFGDPTTAWPTALVKEHTGHLASGTASPATWLAALDISVAVSDVRTAADADRVAVEATLSLDPGAGFLGYPAGWPFVLTSMPDVELRVQPFSSAGRSVRLFASVADDGLELVLEGLPVEILLPSGLLTPHPGAAGGSGPVEVTVGSFTAGSLDDLRVVYRDSAPSSIFVHLRLVMTRAGEFHLRPSVPVSFGPCTLSGIPCRAVHDFRLLASPATVADNEEWVRHDVGPWLPSMTGPYDGLFSVRSIDLDTSAPALVDVSEFLNEHSTDTHPTAELVLDDVVVPFFGPLGLPVPRHLTAGIRRRVLDPSSIEEVFTFERAPVHLTLTRDPEISFIVDSLFYRSLPAEGVAEDLGLTFSAAIVFGTDEGPQNAFEFGLEEEYTIVVGYRRDFDPTTGQPAPGTGTAAAINAMLHWEIAGTVIVDVMGIRAGFSLGRKLGAGRPVGECLLFTADLFVSMPPTGADDAVFRMRSLSGEKVAFALEGLGYRFGQMHFEGVAMPDGVVIFVGPVGLILSEIGVRAEQGASYLSFSGGLMIETSGFTGGLVVRRMRFRVAGDPTRPAFKVDGFFLTLRTKTVSIEAGGYYTEEESAGTRVREFGLTGTIGFEVGPRAYTVGVDLIVGNRRSPTEEFDYLMIQAFFRGQIGPIGYFELTGARLLYAKNMLPKLGTLDRESRDLRYYSWYKGSNPLTVTGDRRLAMWKADNGSWTFGVGAGASLAGMGKVVELSLFVLGMDGPTEGGFLIVGELYVLASTTPLGFLAVEWDGRNDRFSMVIGVNAKVGTFVKGAPAWVDQIGRLTGTLFISNDPGTFAIGRLADQKTWLTLRFDLHLWVRTFILFGFCLEIVEGPTGPKGFALVVRIEGGINASIANLTYHAGFGFVVLIFSTGSTDYSVVVWIEAGIRFTLFGFLKIGVTARAEFRAVGAKPARGELSLEIRLETPWFLPDVTWRLETQFGSLAPESLASASQPLRSSALSESGTKKQLPAHLERFDPAWDGQGVAPVHSVAGLAAPTRPEVTRLANLAADTAARPVATDSTVVIAWSVAVNDRLALGTGLAAGLGDQEAGDLSLTYDLVGLAVRRRSRFGTARPWTVLDDRVELGADFSDPAGVGLDGSFAPQVLSATWDLDVTVGGQPAPKTLLLNSVAPFSFTTRSPETDDALVGAHPTWPCCRPPDEKDLQGLLHEVTWREASIGAAITAPSRFSSSTSTARFLRPAWAHPPVSGGLPTGALVAAVESRLPGVVARADLTEDAARCWVRLAWPRAGAVTLIGYDSAGREVARKELGPGTQSFRTESLSGSGPIRRIEVRARIGHTGDLTHVPVGGAGAAALCEIDWMAYVSVRELVDRLSVASACESGTVGGAAGYEGHGQLAFLPNQEYEVRITTRVGIKHPTTDVVAAGVEEFVYFRTKGLPGLNAVPRTGAEIEPYVRSAYAGGRGGRVYREEPVTLAFSEGFHVAVPLAVRPAGSAAEHTTLMRMQLLVTPDVAGAWTTAFTTTAEDWVVAHRGTAPGPRPAGPWVPVLSGSVSRATPMISADPVKHRLAALTQRAAVPCAPADPRRVVGTVLVAPPQGGGVDPEAEPPGSAQLWRPDARITATVRLEGAGFVDRRPFEAGDASAFQQVPAGRWGVTDGELRSQGSGLAFAVFGETDWNHLSVVVGLAPGALATGVGFGLPGGAGPPSGLFVLVQAPVGGPARLVVSRRTGGPGALVEVAAKPLADASGAAASTEPVTLEVTAFDDVLRATVGEVSLDVDRGEVRDGRLCLVADGPAAVRTLQVQGLDLFSFPVAVSRFRSFQQHVESWSGRLDEITADTLGPGTTVSDVATLATATAADRAQVMAPTAPDAERERLFAHWVEQLGLPIKDEMTALEISRVTEAGRTAALLLETPESLDLTAEVTVTMTRRALVPGPLPLPAADHIGPVVPKVPVPLGVPVGPATTLSARLDRLVRESVETLREDLSATVRAVRPPVDEAILDVEARRRSLRLTLHPSLVGQMAVVTVAPGASTLWRGTAGVDPVGGRSRVLDAAPAGPLPRPPRGSVLGNALADAGSGAVLLLTADLAVLLGVWRPPMVEVEIDVPLTVLQNGDARRALLVPSDPLPTGRYRLALALSRTRWDTTEAADDLNTYQQQAEVVLEM